MPAASQPYWTASMVRDLPDDGNRYECIDGELLVTPSPSELHQWIAGSLYRTVFPYIEEMGVGLVQYSPLDVELDDGMIVQPDVLAFRESRLIERWRAGASSAKWEDGQLVWQPEGATRPLMIDLPAMFDSVPDVFRGQ